MRIRAMLESQDWWELNGFLEDWWESGTFLSTEGQSEYLQVWYTVENTACTPDTGWRENTQFARFKTL